MSQSFPEATWKHHCPSRRQSLLRCPARGSLLIPATCLLLRISLAMGALNVGTSFPFSGAAIPWHSGSGKTFGETVPGKVEI